MATKKKATAPASKVEPAVRNARLPGSRKAGKPTRAEKSAQNKAANAMMLAEETAALRKVMPPGNARVVHPIDGHKPTEYTDELGMHICMRFATEPAMNVLTLNSDPTLPTIWHFYKWLIEHPHLEKAYARAREIQADLQAAELELWSTEPLIGKKTLRRTKTSDDGEEVTEEVQEYDNIERARLRVQTRQWLLAKYRPKKYGAQPLTFEDGSGDALQELIGQFRRRNEELQDA